MSHLAGTMVAVGYHWTNKTVYSAKDHLIWCPKYRRRVLVGGVDERNPYQWWVAWQVAEGRLRSCRIVRTRIRGRWV